MITLTGGNFQDASGNPIDGFTLTLKLIEDSTFGGGNMAYVTLNGNNLITGNNVFSGTTQFTGPITVASLYAQNIEGVQYADQFPGGDIGAKVNAAMAALPSTGGTVYIPAGVYSFSTTITMMKNCQIIGAGSCATFLTYTGTGTALNIDGSQGGYWGIAGPYMNGLLRGFTVSGIGNNNPNKRGVFITDVIGFTMDDLVVANFNATGDVGITFNNLAYFCERASLRKLSVFNNKIGLVFQNSNIGAPSNSVSFGYHRWSEMHFQIGVGQYGIFINGSSPQPVFIYNGNIAFSANCSDSTATVLALVGESSMIDCEFSVFAEGTGVTATGIYVGPDAAFSGSGQVQMNSLNNSVQSGGTFNVNPISQGGPMPTPLGIAAVQPAGTAESFSMDNTASVAHSIANGATYLPFGNNAFSGLLIVNEVAVNGNCGVFIFGGQGWTLISTSAGSSMTETPNNPGTLNVYEDSANSYYPTIQNNLGSTCSVSILSFRTRTAA